VEEGVDRLGVDLLGRLEVPAAGIPVGDEPRVEVGRPPGDVGDGGPDPLGHRSECAPVETEHPDGVLAQHEAQLVVGNAGEGIGQPVGGVRPGAFGVGVVAPEGDRLESDLVAHGTSDLCTNDSEVRQCWCQYSLGRRLDGSSARLPS
jgi:hypothetical protein